MIPFNIITGFLGSGKTTLLKNLLTIYNSQKIAVIQNEYAPTGVDGKELKQASPDFKLVEINNGSVFCVCQFSNFVNVVEKLVADYQPDVIYLETSGLADPISVAELLQSDQLKDMIRLNMVLTVVDAENYFKGLNVIGRFKHQIMIADSIIINKTDLNRTGIEEIERHISTLNPFARKTRTEFCRLNKEMFESVEFMNRTSKDFPGIEAGGRPDELTACVLRVHDKMSVENLTLFLSSLQKKCPRIKGFLNLSDGSCVSIHSVFDMLEIKKLEQYVGPNELVAFGKHLTPGALRKYFKAYI